MRSRLLLLAARIAEYIGWLCQEAGDEQGALWWTRYAADLARAGGDPRDRELRVRPGGRARAVPAGSETTIDLAQQAQRVGRASSRILGMAARREAQGYALAGDRDACERALDRAMQLVDASLWTARTRRSVRPRRTRSGSPAGGRWSTSAKAEAAAVLDRELARVPATSRRARARFGARRSLAYALAGEVDQSCLTLAETLDDAAHVDSATVRTDLRELARTLGRWRNHGAVREIYPELKRLLTHR